MALQGEDPFLSSHKREGPAFAESPLRRKKGHSKKKKQNLHRKRKKRDYIPLNRERMRVEMGGGGSARRKEGEGTSTYFGEGETLQEERETTIFGKKRRQNRIPKEGKLKGRLGRRNVYCPTARPCPASDKNSTMSPGKFRNHQREAGKRKRLLKSSGKEQHLARLLQDRLGIKRGFAGGKMWGFLLVCVVFAFFFEGLL